TGCNTEHPDLKDRVIETKNFVKDEDANDNNGHGTATASNAGGKTYGAAKQAKLICVKALNKDGKGSY
ncbi:serine protease-like protein, partial [Leptotrombidium deliense]